MHKRQESDKPVISNKELLLQLEAKSNHEAELILVIEELTSQNEERRVHEEELTAAIEELTIKITAKAKLKAELIVANKELAFQIEERAKHEEELTLSNRELAAEIKEKVKRKAALVIANNELVRQNDEKKNHEKELTIANKELAFQNEEKEKRAAELAIANKELAFQNEEKGKRAVELVTANIELQKTEQALRKSNELFSKLFDNNPAGICVSRVSDGEILNVNDAFVKLFGFVYKEDIMRKSGREIIHHLNLEQINRAHELKESGPVRNFELNIMAPSGEILWISVSMMELDVNEIPCRLSVSIGITARKRAEEGLIATNKELAFQNEEKEKRAAELAIANKELAFQNEEKERRAEELSIANIELIFQNEEKEKRAAELVIANKELAFQNEEKGKRAAELVIANRELEQFAYIASHDLQEPLRTISNYMRVFEEDYVGQLDDKAHKYLNSVNNAVKRMSVLIKSLLDFSRLDRAIKLVYADSNTIIAEVIADLDTLIQTTHTAIEVTELPRLNLYETEMRQVFQNLISNAIKFQAKDAKPLVRISAEEISGEWRFAVNDNGIGIAPIHYERVFDIFRRLHTTKEYEGNGIGLANCKKIIQLHKGKIWVESILGQGTTFYFTIPNLTQ